MPKKGLISLIIISTLILSCSSAPEDAPTIEEPEIIETDKEKSLHELVLSGDEDKLNEIFKIDIDINEIDKNGRSPLHIACETGNNKIARFLILEEANLNIQDKEGYTPLHLALDNNNLEIIENLVDNGASIFLKDNKNRTPYSIAFIKGMDYVKALIADESINDKDKVGKSLIHYAATEGEFDIINYLISRKADVNNRDNSDSIALDYALLRPDSLDHAKSAEILIKSSSLNAKTKDFDYLYRVLKTEDLEFRFEFNKTALHIAAEQGHLGFVSLFIEKGVNLELRDRPGNTSLHTAVVNNNIDVIKLLLKNGAQIDARDYNNNTPLHLSLSFSYSLDIPKLLIRSQADINAKDDFGNTPLHLTLSLKLDKEIAELLLDNGADTTIRNKAGNTALTEAVIKNNKEIALLLLDDKSGIYSKNDRGESPLTIGIDHGIPVLEWLINDENINYKNNDGDTPIIIAIREDAKPEIITFLIDKGAKINTRNKNGWTPLHEAVILGNGNIISILNQNEADFFSINNNGENAFDLVFDRGVEYTENIVTSELVDLRNSRENTPLFYAIDRGSPDIVQVLLDKGADINASNVNGETPLHQAITTDNIVISNMLISRGSNIEAKDKQDNTPLHHCVFWNASETARLLVDNGALIDSKNRSGRTPLHEAVLSEDRGIVTFFIRKGSNLNSRDNNGQTPLYYAVKNNQFDILSTLIDAGADVSLRDRQGNTILHAAALGEHKEAAQILISKNSDIFAENKFGDTPVSLIITTGLSNVKWFFNRSNKNSMDNKGYSALHLAVKHRADLDVIEYLIELGADKDNINKDGFTPYEYAKEEGFEIALPILK